MTVVVSDTTPIHYLALTGNENLLPRLFEKIIIPEAVLMELQHPKTPTVLRKWATSPLPEWVQVEAVVENRQSLGEDAAELGQGEVSAMLVALEGSFPLLIDDQEARRVAEIHGIETLGTLSVLIDATRRGWIEFRPVAERLREAGFYISRKLIDQVERVLDKEQ